MSSNNKKEFTMSVKDAIYNRHAVRDYLPQKVDHDLIHILLDAAVHAPTAMHEEPWSFVVIQDMKTLDRLSDSAKELVLRELNNDNSAQAKLMRDLVSNPSYHVLYNASTLVVIYAQFDGQFVVADFWLAAQNLMLAACANDLGSCVIGFAVSALNTQEWKTELGVPDRVKAIVPIIIGIPASTPSAVSRKKPNILTWKS